MEALLVTGDSKNIVKLSRKGYALLNKRRYRDAEAAFLEAYGLAETNAYVLVGLGDVCRKLKRFDDAVKYY